MCLRQGTLEPVGPGLGLGERHIADGGDEILVAQGRAETGQAGRDLSIEHGPRRCAGQAGKQADVLTAAVEHLGDRCVGQKFPDRREIVAGQRVDQPDALAVADLQER